MVYSTEDQVRAICDTDITDSELIELIEETDALMDLKLNTGAMGAILKRMVSRTWTAYRCMLKDPNAQGLGEYSEDRATTLKLLKDELDDVIKTSGGGIAFTYSYARIPFGD